MVFLGVSLSLGVGVSVCCFWIGCVLGEFWVVLHGMVMLIMSDDRYEISCAFASFSVGCAGETGS